ncbi:MAG: helix-turn-helix transcriptional regulator [Gammaproteobacteria bacterium]|jgi:DNA-binding CsgD family transcriptional regulator/PAS domain-containing protein|nr:helix-turn-helix transcriptional regulator [Gammaproteobacteria bacterium]MBT4299687.1 helix-turn-helix transcriptional regulator [Gammaproteobacteria bacterium]MBT4547876.1 helix-turn-helix transcriptional regulator [Gammaproteobacteria bacterium]MBT4788677.1 helix-turn-helix transcriptional regulator [Gammaproteobacteria bacterium]MBT5372721.1 helix-turn-helix transcriptional regulator [Gammaproteobacteria bacterium]
MNDLMPPDDLLDTLYSATTDFSQWSRFMEGFANQFDATAASFDKIKIGDQDARFSAVYGLNPDYLDLMMEQHVEDPRDEFVHQFLEKPLLTHECASEAEWKKSGMYRNIFIPMCLEYFIVVMLPLENEVFAVFSVYRPPGAVPFGEYERSQFGNFIPHLKRAVHLQEQFLKVERERWGALAVLDELPIGVIVVDLQTRVQFSNQLASKLMEDKNGLHLRHNELWANQHNGSTELRGLVRDCVKDQAPRVVLLERDGSKKPLQVRINALGESSGQVFVGEFRQMAVIYVTDPDRPQETHSELLQRLFGLTPTEAKLTAQLVLGHSLDEASEILGVAKSTSRTHLLSIFSKTSTNRQADLIKAVVTSPLWVTNP